MKIFSQIAMALLFALEMGSLAQAAEPTLQLSIIGPNGPSPFPKQLRVQVTNESFTSYPLAEKMKTAELLVDDHPYKRQDLPFEGPPGLSPQATWEGCQSLNNYVQDGIPPGHHRLALRIGENQSPAVRVRFDSPVAAASEPKDRLRQAKALEDALAPGLLKSCVENWLTDRDGGLDIAHSVRYYVDPDVKVLVPYDKTVPEPRIRSSVKVYNESRVAD